MINLEFLKSDDFYVNSGLVYFGSTTNASHVVSQHPSIEQAKRFLVEDDFPQIDKFISNLIKNNLKAKYHFPYEYTLIALAVVLAEYETSTAEAFFNELQEINQKGGCSELPLLARIAAKLDKLRDDLSPIKNAIRLKDPEAVFLPLEELNIVAFEKTNDSTNNLAIAISVGTENVNLYFLLGKSIQIPKTSFTSNAVSSPDFSKPYLTDYGQTVGFGNFGSYEAAVADLI